MFRTRGDKVPIELLSATNPAHLAEQQNLVSPRTCRSKIDASTPSVRGALWLLCDLDALKRFVMVLVMMMMIIFGVVIFAEDLV